MHRAERSGPIYRFAAFELDPGRRELRKRGMRIKLQEQPLEILLPQNRARVIVGNTSSNVTLEAFCAASLQIES